MILRAFLPLLVLIATISLSQASLWNHVPSSARAQIAQGQLVVVSQDVAGDPWPRLILYQVVNAPSLVIWHLFTDYGAAPSYTPGLISAKVIASNPSADTKDVQYTVKVPVIGSATYAVRNTYIKKKRAGSYEVAWTLIKSPLAKSSDGSLQIETYDNNQTLLCYTNLCVPISNLLAGLKGQALDSAKTTVSAIKTEAEKRAAAGQN